MDSKSFASLSSGLLARKGYPSGLAFEVVRAALAADGGDGTEVPGLDVDPETLD